MTPLAQQILSQLCLPKAKREFHDNIGLLPMMDDVHCFEISAIMDHVIDLACYLGRRVEFPPASLIFLPAPKTWIEWKEKDADAFGRAGCLLVAHDVGRAKVFNAISGRTYPSGRYVFGAANTGYLSLTPSCTVGDGSWCNPIVGIDKLQTVAHMWRLYAALALINSPRVVGRKSHMPHAGLQRALNRKASPVGRYPLNAWTEITLNVQAPQVASDAVQTVRLSGRKALHFVRAHVRLVQDRLVLVSAHWRGDAAIGIKQSRYKVQPGRAAA